MSDRPNDQKDGVLSRWSQRKAAARKQREAPTQTASDPTLTAALAPDLNPINDENLPVQADPAIAHDPATKEPEIELPDINTLTEESDYSAFMAPNVSTELRNLALRKLFKSSVFNVRDGLDDYDEDFTSFEKLGDIITSDMRHHAERKEKERLLREQEELAAASEDQPAQGSSQEAQNADDAPTELSTETVEDLPTGDEPGSSTEIAANSQDAPVIRPTDTDATLMSGKIRRRPNESA